MPVFKNINVSGTETGIGANQVRLRTMIGLSATGVLPELESIGRSHLAGLSDEAASRLLFADLSRR